LKKIKLFCDGSCNPQEKIGYGAYLLVEDDNFDLISLKSKIIFKKFGNTSSSKLEIETLLWALNDIDIKDCIIEVYTDCQNIIGLQDRREKLEKNNFQTSAGKIMNNHELYKDFFEKIEEKS
jgi:ribonuclease HI